MDTRYLSLTRACDRSCGFCDVRANDSRPLRLRAQAAAAQLRSAVAAGAKAVVLTGAEPTLEPYLVDLVALARRLGVADIALQTHAGRIDAQLAGQLAAAGLRRAEVALNSLDSDTADAITGSAGDMKRTAAGIRALLSAGVDVDLAVALVATNTAHLTDLCQRAGRLASGCKGRLRRVLVRAIGESAGPCELAALAAVVRALTVAATLEPHDGPALQQAQGWELPPCLFAAPAWTPALFALSSQRTAKEADRFTRLRGCSTCALADRCPGCPPAWAGRAEALANPAVCVPLAEDGAPENTVLEHDDLQPLVPAEAERRWAGLLSGLGLRPTVRLEDATRAALCSRQAPAHPPWPISATACDREALELKAGLRVLLRREVPDASRVAGAVDALRGQGLCVCVVQSAVPGVAGQARTHVFAALEDRYLSAAAALDPALLGRDGAKDEAVRQFGLWFGYPTCCVEAFARGGDRDDATLVADRVGTQRRTAIAWPANWAVVPARLGSFLPCSSDCPAALAHTLAVATLVGQAAPDWLAAARPLLQSVVVTQGFDRAAVLLGAGAIADGWAYQGVVGPTQLAGQAAFVPRLALLAFECAIVEPLRLGNRLVCEGRDLRVLRDGETVHLLQFLRRPGVVDFTADVASA